MTDLMIPERSTAMEVFSKENGLSPYLEKIREEIDAFNPDISTKSGRDKIASIAHKVARSKTALDSMGKELVAELKEVPKKIDAERKRMRDLLDSWKDEVRQPLTEWEQAETERVASIKARIAGIESADPTDCSSEEIAGTLSFVKSVTIDDSFEEFASDAAKAKDSAINRLELALIATQKREQEQAELERLRAEQLAREQAEREAAMVREAEDRVRKEAEQAAAVKQAESEAAARAEREAAERKELELKLQAERAEREKQEAERRAEQAAAQERQRFEDEKRKEAEETAKREANKNHKAAINNAAASALVDAGLTQDQAKAVIIAIASGKVPAVKIHY